jgi:succinyl-CoA synthetase beta subunit
MVEINPMVQDTFGDVMCLDAKVNFDDNAAFRQQAVFGLRDTSQVRESGVRGVCSQKSLGTV